MQTGALERWWPVTYDFGAIRSDLESVAMMRHKQYADAGIEVATTSLRAPLEKCLSMLEPLVPAPTKELFLATNSGWTVFLANGYRGSDPFLPMWQLSKSLGVTGLRACVTPDSLLYQGVILETYDTPDAGGDENGYRRSIVAMNDGGRWVFIESGVPYAFEDVAKYDARRKRDRFTADMLARYLEHLGFSVPTDEMLEVDGQSRGVLIARPYHAHMPSYSLDQAKAFLST